MNQIAETVRTAEPRPLYALVFSLLLVLVLATFMVEPVTFPQTHNTIPRASTALPERTSHPLLGIDYTGTYWLIVERKGERVAPHELSARMVRLYESRSERVLLFSASPGTEYSRVLDVLEAARAANVERISLIASCPAGEESLVERCRA